MRIEQEPFYYFSDEFFEPVFPVRCHFINWLGVMDSPIRAMRVRGESPFGSKKLSQFILLPKGGKSFSDVPDQDIFPVFVFEVDDRVQGDMLDLREGLTKVQDWSCICFSEEFAKSRALAA